MIQQSYSSICVVVGGGTAITIVLGVWFWWRAGARCSETERTNNLPSRAA